MMNSPAKKKAKTEPSPPDMSALHAPTSKGWGKSEWTQWENGLDARLDALREDANFNDFGAFIDARDEAVLWAAPEEITVKISIEDAAAVEPPKENNDEKAAAAVVAESSCSDATKTGGRTYTKTHEIVLSKQGTDTFRSILDKYCKEKNIERDNYRWSHKSGSLGVNSLLNQTDVECFSQFWHPHVPTLVSRFVDENSFLPEIVGMLKKGPSPKPSVAPSFERLKSPPPDGNAGREEWKKWHRSNSCGCVNFWMDKNKAVEYMCPDHIDIVLKGLSHEHTVKVKADEPLAVALSSYCTSTTGTEHAVNLSDVILRSYGDYPEYIDAQETSARTRFNGYSPLKMEVVYRDTSRTEAELEAIRGPIPEGYQRFLGSGFRLSDTEQPWVVTKEYGMDMYNKIGKEALMIYEGTDYKPGYDPVHSWFVMMGKIKSVLGDIVRKPHGGWSAESAAKALDGLTAALLNLTYNDDWSRDALGKIMLANPACRKESVSVLRKMDNCAVSAINAANEFTTAPAPTNETGAGAGAGAGGFGLERALRQLKRLLAKYRDEYGGFSENAYDFHGRLVYYGHEPFSTALPLINN
mmetsp:Transcript_11927/g.19545  ORF Transcript_11927/g.19545 Transcript_11927/m.19545 type:complete len:582 (+) Transcript_11927:102-1847(+)